MLFTQIVRGQVHPPRSPRQAFLVRDGWNDYGYVTMFQLQIVDDAGTWHAIGNLKVGGFGVPEGWTAWSDLPSQFEILDGSYFTLGVDDTYYENLNDLGPAIRVEVLTALRDLAYYPALLRRAETLDVTTTSLLRGVPVSVVQNQFSRIARGGARVTPYEFEYQPAERSFNVSPTWERSLEFTVLPGQQPPTNTHVLIGRNAAGKSYLLRNVVRAVADRRADPTEVGRIIERGTTSGATFRGVVAVSFSAFDEFVSIPTEHQAVPYVHIGAHWPEGDYRSARLDRHQLADMFSLSLEACLTGPAAERWRTAVATLRYSGSGFLEDDSWTAEFGGASAEQRRTMATGLFASLSSGHAIVLLTITSLVERVHERTLVVLDEPEAHLHPPLLAAFVRALSDLLLDRNGVAIVATHSPVVLQEVPSSCVWLIRRHGTVVVAQRPSLQTFGENVGILTHEVFSLEVTDSGYHRMIRAAVRDGMSYEAVLGEFGGQLGTEAKAIARTLIAVRDSGGEP
ncbi:AAA family ATPase [Dactylosporangium sp. NPDC000521]|uniref:AAA family ATPase n=1 Tax=Dactylosporangium sp. NPDC000521 TaxID=3363975 RepID=UPI0036CD2DA4